MITLKTKNDCNDLLKVPADQTIANWHMTHWNLCRVSMPDMYPEFKHVEYAGLPVHTFNVVPTEVI